MKTERSGTAVLLGDANAGKSSLINALVGEKVSIVTDLAGTTRDRIRGFLKGETTVNTPNDTKFKVIFTDIPGMQANKIDGNLSKHMSKSISAAVAEADIICYVIDALTSEKNFDENIVKINNYKDKQTLIVAVNKTDKTNYEKLYPRLLKLNELKFAKAIVPVSAKTGFNLNVLIDEIVKNLPKTNIPETDKISDEYTDTPLRKMCEEIIRAELIKSLRAEIPYGIAVSISSWHETNRCVEICADIICEKKSHKPIIIGKNGTVIKKVGMAARCEIEKITDKQVKLYTNIMIRPDWKNDKSLLDTLGYS